MNSIILYIVVCIIVAILIYITDHKLTMTFSEEEFNKRIKERELDKKETFYSSIETDDATVCPFCNSTDIYGGGSWSPEKCSDCGAIYFMRHWHER